MLVSAWLVVAALPAEAGSSWSIVTSPNTSTTQSNMLRGVTCLTASNCWAVGIGNTGTYDQTLIEQWNGSAWSIVTSPNTSTTQSNDLFGVTCVTASNCWAVGRGGVGQTLIEQWNGSAWSIVTSPSQTAIDGQELDSVSCDSSTDCWAVGYYTIETGTTIYEQTLIEQWNGSAWSIVTSPSTSTTQSNFLYGVTCISASDCWAVGNHYSSTGGLTLVEQWNGSAWSIVTSANVSTKDFNSLSGVTCLTASNCWAVGYYYAGGGGTYEQTLIEQWNGSAWSIVTSPNTSTTQNNTLYSISCITSSDCWAVGYGNSAPYQTLVEQWNGSGWSIVTSPNMSTTQNNYLVGVSCDPVSGNCWAVGYYYTGTYDQTLIETSLSTQTITFTSTAPTNAVYNGPTYTATATASSGLTVTFSSGTTSVCTSSGTNGSVFTFVGTGTCTVLADQAGNSSYLAAPEVSQSFTVGMANQTITFTSTAPSGAVYNGTYIASATDSGGSSNPVDLSTGTPLVCTATTGASPVTFTFAAAGTCTVDANQAGNADYNVAPQVQQSFTVGQASQTISTSTAPGSASVGGAPYTASATASSGLQVWIATDGTSTGCTLTAGYSPVAVYFSAVGTCVLDFTQAGNSNYLAAPQVQQSFSVAIGSQTINFNSPSGPSNPTVGGATYPATPPIPAIATATSGLTVSISSTTTSVCTVASNTVTFVGAGTCTLDANQAGNTNYLAAPQVQQSFTVGPASGYTGISCPAGSTFCALVTNKGGANIWSSTPMPVPAYLVQ
jgi:hypothetical protein